MKNTLLHEIAHALAGHEHNHDEVWKATARSIGCDGCRCGHWQQTTIEKPCSDLLAHTSSVRTAVLNVPGRSLTDANRLVNRALDKRT